jgi:hypothetical protein
LAKIFLKKKRHRVPLENVDRSLQNFVQGIEDRLDFPHFIGARHQCEFYLPLCRPAGLHPAVFRNGPHLLEGGPGKIFVDKWLAGNEKFTGNGQGRNRRKRMTGTGKKHLFASN